jgi:hypothetical protein
MRLVNLPGKPAARELDDLKLDTAMEHSIESIHITGKSPPQENTGVAAV